MGMRSGRWLEFSVAVRYDYHLDTKALRKIREGVAPAFRPGIEMHASTPMLLSLHREEAMVGFLERASLFTTNIELFRAE